jgi:GNAT superfamily N-acetyltransferase
MSAADHALYANHRRFLEAQRGVVTQHEGYDLVHGDTSAFQIALLHEARVAEEAAARAAFVFAPPWGHPGATAASFAGLDHQLTHMSLPDDKRRAPEPMSGLSVEQVRDEAQLRAFTQVQAAGFASGATGYEALFAWMWDKNARAFEHSDQHYYCLLRHGAPVSVLLTVNTIEAVGIYAVATPPDLRKQGLSSHLLGRVCAATPAGTQICLQVTRGSDAERLYKKVGFVERFVVDVYRSALRPT